MHELETPPLPKRYWFCNVLNSLKAFFYLHNFFLIFFIYYIWLNLFFGSFDIMMKKVRDVHNFSAKTFKGVLFTGAQASKKLGKALFHHIYNHLPIPRQWYVEKIWFRYMDKTWAKTVKGSLFTAQASKTRKKLLFNTSVRMTNSETWSKLEQREPKAPCSQAPKQAKPRKSSFPTHL